LTKNSEYEPDSERQMSMKVSVFPLLAICGALAASGLSVRAVEAPPPQLSATVSAAPPPGAAPEFSGRITDVVTLAKSGVDESVVLSYVKNSPGPFSPSAEEIIKLRDEGISPNIINAMLDRSSELRAQATAAAQPYAVNPSQAPVITSEPPSNTTTSADTGSAGYATQPDSTVVYVGGGGDYGYPYYYSGYPYYWGYPSAFFAGGFISTPFFFPFPCWFNGCFFPHGCSFPHGGFVHGGFHGSFHDGNGFHSGFHGSGGSFASHSGSGAAGFHSGTAGFHSGSVSGFHSGFAGSTMHSGFSGGSFHGGGVSMGGFHGSPMGSFHGGSMGGFHGGSMGGFHGGMGGGFHGGMGGGGFHGGMMGGGGGFHGGGGGGGHR
jgi:hypothetical protein